MRNNQLRAGVLLTYAGMMISNLISILYTPVMLRFLGQQEYGIYQLAYSVVSYLGLLSFGFGSSYIRFYSRYRKEDDEKGIATLNGMFLVIYCTMAMIALVAGMAITGGVDRIFSTSMNGAELEITRKLMKLMVLNIAFSFPNFVFESYIIAFEQYTFQRILNLTLSVLNPFLTLPLLLMGYRSISLTLIQTVLTVTKLLVNFWFCSKKLKMRFSFRGFYKGMLVEISRFSFFIFLNMIVDQINWNVDKFIVGRYRGSAAVAVYAVGAQINQYYVNLSTAVSSVFIPRVNRIVAETDDHVSLTELLARVGRIQFLVLGYILNGFVLLGGYFLNIWAGTGYKEAYGVVLLLILPVTIPLIQNLGIEIQRAENRHHFRSYLYLLMAAVNLLISIPLTIWYGIHGAAAGTCLCLLVGNGLIMNWYNHVKIGLDMVFFWKQILPLIPGAVAALAAGGILSAVIRVDTITDFLWVGVIYTIVYGVLQWRIGMNAYEKSLIMSLLKRKGGALC